MGFFFPGFIIDCCFGSFSFFLGVPVSLVGEFQFRQLLQNQWSNQQSIIWKWGFFFLDSSLIVVLVPFHFSLECPYHWLVSFNSDNYSKTNGVINNQLFGNGVFFSWIHH